MPLTVTKNTRLGYLMRVRRRIANLKDTCNPGVLKLDKRSTASERLAEAWQKYKSSHQDVPGMVVEYEIVDDQATFIKMEEAYKSATDNAKKTIKGERRADDAGRTLQPERAAQLAMQRTSPHNQVREILDCVEEDLEKVEVTQLQKALKMQRELLTKAERRMQGAKRRTKELLDNGINNWEDLQQDKYRRCLEFVRRWLKLTSLIAILGDALENFTDMGENDKTPADEVVPAGEAPAEEAAVALDKMLRDPDIKACYGCGTS